MDHHVVFARLSGLSDADLHDAIAKTRNAFRGWGMGARLTRLASAIDTAPGCRVAYQMRSTLVDTLAA